MRAALSSLMRLRPRSFLVLQASLIRLDLSHGSRAARLCLVALCLLAPCSAARAASDPVKAAPEPVKAATPDPTKATPEPAKAAAPEPAKASPAPAEPVPQPSQSVPEPVKAAPAPGQAVPEPAKTEPAKTGPEPAKATPDQACTTARTTLEAARKAGDLRKAIEAYGGMTKAETGCDPKLLFCEGRAIALAHVERAYASADKGDAAAAAKLLADGRKFGEPWPLLIGLGDAETARAHASHNARDWGAASLDYQKAVLALAEPVLCGDEPARPAPAVIEALYRKMSAALMLGTPIEFAHTKCAPCALAFLGPTAGFTPRSQPLPITFQGRSALITPDGLDAAKALLGCILARKASQVTISVHTDEGGGDAANKVMSDARLAALRKIFVDGGYKGTFEAQPKGRSEPFVLDEPKSFTADERHRLNRRVELRSATLDDTLACQ